ncbi:MAG: alpha-L-fucosidase [Bacteroidia bacterium]|nr:alpha-L-fucosidase [Bacteroidia bacterium]
MRQKIILFFLLLAGLVQAQQKPSQQWLDQKFSMFIHFGLYSVYGGVYNGNPVKLGYSEQIQAFAGIFSDWYANTAQQFNPTKWNADEVVALAKATGMKSIVFTSKHHDGFCMYHSQYTDFNIVDATPYGRDLMKELAGACARGGIDFAVYYSLIDWNFPQAYPISSHNADPLTSEHYAFNLKQVEEIMKNYGSISEIWFDMGSLTPKQSKGLYDLVNRLQPQCMISGRLGNDYVDFAVMPDNVYPNYKMNVPWQTAASMFDETWSYRSWQERGEVQMKVNEKIASLIKVISRGGNYLLNIGPRGDGSVVEFERDVLLEMGKWIKANAEAIYGTKANPLPKSFAWGDVTTKGNNLFAFVERIPASLKIQLSGFNGKVSGVRLLSTGKAVPFKQNTNLLEIDLSDSVSIESVPVLKISFANGFDVLPTSVISNGFFTTHNATPVFGHSSLNYYAGYKSLTGYDWAFRSNKRQVTPEIIFSDNEKGRQIEIMTDENTQKVILNSSNQKTVRLPKNSVKWGDLHRKRSSMVFGHLVDLEGDALISTNKNWQKVNDFQYGEVVTEKIVSKSGIAFLQEIESAQEQQVAVEIMSGNALYVLLNGKYITAHFSRDRVKSDNEIIFLPLKKGNNQLVIVYYNGFEKEFSYKITPLEQWTVYSQKLSPIKLDAKKEIHSLSVRDAQPISSVAPLRMNNVQIKL